MLALLALIEPDGRGDPMSPPHWTTKCSRHPGPRAYRAGHYVSLESVADLLRGDGFSPRGNTKTVEGRQHPDWGGQFRYTQEHPGTPRCRGPHGQRRTKKKEVIGRYKNAGREWRDGRDRSVRPCRRPRHTKYLHSPSPRRLRHGGTGYWQR
ncbi:ISAzo13-like element transposase-related protein [Streptomyces zagrosensis]|uniref:ISAzo13-like element transposase-related protein n=1 Tax=Streptomyces zagrosensis TaxID=1042984 RepID=UPI0035E42CF2